MSTERPRVSPFVRERPDLPMNIAVFIALGVAFASVGSLLRDQWWWFASMGIALIVMAAIVIARLALPARFRGWSSVIGLLALVAALCLFNAPTSSILGIIPTFDTIAAFDDLIGQGAGSIQRQKIPAVADPGILFILAAALGLVTVLVDLLAIVARKPAATGFVYLVLVAVPTLIAPDLTDVFLFLLAAAAWLVIVHLSSPYVQPRRAFAVGAASLIGAVIIQLIVMPEPRVNESGNVQLGYTTGLNPILTLGDSLRNSDPVPALRYTTDTTDPGYLTFSVLERFDGEKGWTPNALDSESPTSIDDIDTAPGRGEGVEFEEVTTKISVGAVGGRWLPVPYAPTSIDGVVGTWSWQRSSLGIRSTSSSMQGQKYTVESEIAQPTIAQLREAGTEVAPGQEDFLLLPPEFPAAITSTAELVTGDAETNYDKAIALQEYFHEPEFEYSTDAPVRGDFDGTDSEIIAEFLQVKSGYCVHYASAMAVMARSIGIPARVSVGFTPGEYSNTDDGPSWLVTTDNLHAWPELYFVGIGWVRFEPTPGQGSIPSFPQGEPEDETDPDETSTPTPTETPGASSAPDDEPSSVPTSSGSAAQETPEQAAVRQSWNGLISAGIALGVFLLLLSPAIARALRRRRRVGAVHTRGDAFAAWDEVIDTAIDYGFTVDDAETAREVEQLLGSTPALAALREALEVSAYDVTSGTARLADLRQVRADLRRSNSRLLQARADLAPRSELQRWFGRFLR